MTESMIKEGREKKGDLKEKEEKKIKKRIFSPEMCSYTNEDNTGYVIEVVLPGVEKDTIKLKMTDEDIFVIGETEYIKYVGSYGLCRPIENSEATAKYKNGLLKIEAPFKDIKLETVDIDIE